MVNVCAERACGMTTKLLIRFAAVPMSVPVFAAIETVEAIS